MPMTTFDNELYAFAPLPEGILKYYAQQLLSGLVALNQVNLTHNNISPFAIVLSPDFNRAKLSDFDQVYDITSNDVPILGGQPGYQAPEMLAQI